jgi:ABC-2 type transport system ATP-binding protein
MLTARGLTKWYGGILAVSDVSFTVGAGEVLGYLGPNGSGKTTTVGMLTGLVEPSRGEVRFRDEPVVSDPVEFRRQVGWVAKSRIDALLDLFGLQHQSDAPMSSYSKGMRQKVLISAALLHDPALLIFDEPVSGLDATSAIIFRHLLDELARQGKAVLYCSHELDAVEKSCSRVLVLHRGRVVAHDTVGRLRAALSSESLEDVFQQLVCEINPAETARDLVAAMRLRA